MVVNNGTLWLCTEIPPTITSAQDFVGGYVRLIQLAPDEQMLVNEEGLLLQLPINYWASLRAHQTIVGNVVLMTGTALWRD